MSDEKKKISPDVCSYVDDDHTRLSVEVSLPGVKKGNINLKMHEDSLNLSAPREDFVYVATYSFCCPVSPDKAKADYENGLLKIEVPFKDPMEDAISVKID